MDLKKQILGKVLELYNLLISKGFKPEFANDNKEDFILKNGKNDLYIIIVCEAWVSNAKVVNAYKAQIVANGKSPINIGFYHKDLIPTIKKLLY